MAYQGFVNFIQGVGSDVAGGKYNNMFQLIGGLASTVATLKAGESEYDASREQAAQARNEAALAEMQALQEEIRGEEEKRLRKKEADKLRSRQIAKFAKAGVKVDEGSPLLVLAETSLDAQEDMRFIQEGTDARAGSFRHNADTFRRSAHTFRDIGRGRRSSSRLKAGQGLLSSIADYYT